jgi:6-phosphofructokinase 1
MKMRIGILTGGGDVPGLNPAIRAVVTRAMAEGHTVLGFRRGWMGLLHLNPDDPESVREFTLELNLDNTRTVERNGGTFLHTARVNPWGVAPKSVPAFISKDLLRPGEGGKIDCTLHVKKVLERMGIDVLVPIGGEDTLGYASRLHREGYPMVSIPKTMDNDVFGTDYCIGFSTSISLSVKFIHQLRTCTGSHERIGVVELFGRYSGETSLIAGYLAAADRVLIPEVPFSPERVAELILKDKRDCPSHYSMLTISEGALPEGGDIHQTGEADAFGHKKLGGIGQQISKKIEELTGEKTMFQTLGYLMRSGPPDALDLMVAKNYGNSAMDLIGKKEFGRMVALQGGKYTHVQADMPLMGTKTVDVETLYDKVNYLPKVKTAVGLPMFLY